MFIHHTAIIVIPFIWLIYFKSIRLVRVIAFTGIVGSIYAVVNYETLIQGIFSSGIGWYGKYQGRFQDEVVGASRYIWIAELSVAIILFLYNNRHNGVKTVKENSISILMIVVYFVLCLLSIRFSLLMRIARFFQIATIGIYDELILICRRRFGKVGYCIVTIPLIIMLSIVFLITVYSNSDQYLYSFLA